MADSNNLSSAHDATAIKKESNGTITFANEVIATIAGLAAADIPGVAGMSGGFVDGLKGALGRENITKGIKVEVGTEQVAVDISIVVEYGRPITQIAEQIQSSVKKAIETMTGLEVVEVNIDVQGIKFKDTSSEQAAPANTPAAPEQEEKPARVK